MSRANIIKDFRNSSVRAVGIAYSLALLSLAVIYLSPNVGNRVSARSYIYNAFSKGSARFYTKDESNATLAVPVGASHQHTNVVVDNGDTLDSQVLQTSQQNETS